MKPVWIEKLLHLVNPQQNNVSYFSILRFFNSLIHSFNDKTNSGMNFVKVFKINIDVN